MDVEQYFYESIETKKRFIENNKELVEQFAARLIECLGEGGKILICGNGGSASDAQHFAAELVGRYKKDRKSLAAIALTTDTSILTAISNDYGYEEVFAKQVEALGKENDLLVAISTSGNSLNVIRAVEKAKELGIYTIGLLGRDGGKLRNLVDLAIVVDSKDTPHIQEVHETVLHVVAGIVEEALFS
ncbi:D-sedoheptulose 7-phosphate isomerase [Candidatus Woesearchaeota archaeon]|nr:D-sedoheptulose 7-phosphate isomerase [Candidatus Woesearchaeota archaeon]